MESVATTTSSLSIGPPHGRGRSATGSARATAGKRASIGISSNNKAFRAMAALASARASNNINGNSSSSSTSTGPGTSIGTAGSSIASNSIDKRQNKGSFSIVKSKGNGPATATPSSLTSTPSSPTVPSSSSHQSSSSFLSASPSAAASAYTSTSASTFHAAPSASHSAAKPSSRLYSNGHDRDRHGLELCQPQGFRPPAAHSAHTISTSTALKPVIPSPSSSKQATFAVSTTTGSSSTVLSAPNSASSTPIVSKSTFFTDTSSSTPSSPALRAVSNRHTQRTTSRNASPLLRQAPSLPVLSVVPPPGQDRGDGEARRPAMQRVSSFLPSWEKRNSTPRTSFFGWASNRASTGPTSAPSPSTLAKINTAAANANARISLGTSRMQREAFWPATLDGECEKAARILKSFSTDGYLAPLEDDSPDLELSDAGTPVQITKKIPRRIIQNAAGIAIFTCMRSGLWMTGSGGSGILIARKSDGTWSPPSGIMLHTPALSFIIGVDIYDCVLVINNLAALESITKPRVTLGEDVGLTSGPLVSLDSDESHIRWKDLGNTVLTYMKSRGQNQSVDLNGCILAERTNENERFYSSSITQMDILAGNVSRDVDEVRPLSEVIKMAEGRSDYDAEIIERIAIEPAPGDAVIATPKASTPASPRNPIAFGIPNVDDPDPFGVLALEMAGLEIREAGTRLRPDSNQFDFNPAPSSPAFAKFSRQSVDNYGTRTNSNRASFMSSRTVRSQMTDAGTQTTKTDSGNTPDTSPSPSRSEDGYGRTSPTQIPEVTEEEEVDYTKIDMTPLKHLSEPQTTADVTSQGTTTAQDTLTVVQPSRDDTDKASSFYETEDEDMVEEKIEDEPTKKDEEEGNDEKEDRMADDEDEMDDSEDEEEEPVVFEVAAVQPARTQAVASRVIHVKGNMVTIPKRVPPPLPVRSPARTSRSSKTEIGDVSHLKSPLRQEFNDSENKSDEEPQIKRQSSPYLRPVQVKIVSTKSEKSRDSLKSESDTELTPVLEADYKPIEATQTQSDEVESTATPKADSKNLDPRASVHQLQHSDSSDSLSKKHTSSIYTGATEDRWSMDGSSLTTPTSDRPFSVIGDATEDETPRKLKECDRVELNEKYDELEKIGSKETTPNTITVA